MAASIRVPPLIPISVAWGAGLVLGHYGLAPACVQSGALGLVCLIPAVALLLWWNDRGVRLANICALALLLGGIRYQTALPDLEDAGSVAFYNDRGWVTLEGIVTAYPEQRDTHVQVLLDVRWIEVTGQQQPVHGTVLAQVPPFPLARYGDAVRVAGLLRTPSSSQGGAYRDYLARRGIHSVLQPARIREVTPGHGRPCLGALLAIKDQVRDGIARAIPEPEAALLQGILLGIRSGIPHDLYDDFNTTGTSHIIVISGTNLVLLSGLLLLSLGRLVGKRPAIWLTLACILAYVTLVGGDAPVVRAGIMSGLVAVARALGRRSSAVVSVVVSATLMTLARPLALWDTGFQLSFAATLGLILLGPAIEQAFAGLGARAGPRWWVQPMLYLGDLLVVVLAAQALTLPLVVLTFGRLPATAPLANILIAPVQPLIMGWGGLAALLSAVPFFEPIGRVLLWVPWLCLAYTRVAVQWLASWPMASAQISTGVAVGLASAWCLLLASTLRRRRAPAGAAPAHAKGTLTSVTPLAGQLMLLALTWLAMRHAPDGRLHVTFLDVGQGDAVFITTPSGQQILLDGGPGSGTLVRQLSREMPFWDRSLDLLVSTHPDADHVSGLVEILQRFRVGAWLDNGSPPESELLAECERRLLAAGVSRHAAVAGDVLELDAGVRLEVLHPPRDSLASLASPNDRSLVVRLVWGNAAFLLTGDIEAAAEGYLVSSGTPLRADVLKLAHHGSAGSSAAEFLAAVEPGYAVISVGADNRVGHPAPAVLERLARVLPAATLRTDEDGTIRFTTDGHALQVRTER